MSRSRKLWFSVFALAAAGGLYTFAARGNKKEPEALAAPPAAPEHEIACLGRIEPAGGLFQVAPPSSAGRPVLVSRIDVREGDHVRPGQLLAVLDGKSTLDSSVRQSEAKLALAQIRLAQSKAGPKAGDLAVQNAEIARLQVDLDNAQTEAARYARLVQAGDLAASQLEEKRARVATLNASLNAAKVKLDSLSEIRKVDVDVAAQEVAAAQVDVEHARLGSQQAFVHSPIDGYVVQIVAKPGEEVGSNGILQLAYTNRMYVLAEVYETQVRFLKSGQKATITSAALPNNITGTVEKIGMEVGRTHVFPASPAAVTDARVVQVQIVLDAPKEVAGLIGGQVMVSIAK
jgi:HlyD family secretion protein